MKVKNIKSFIDFYKSIGVTIEMGKNQRKIEKEGHFQLTTSPKKINIENHKKLESNIDLNTLKKKAMKLDCNLKDIASNFVFNDGNFSSDIMVIGEAPGEEEDKIGKPFVGQAGKLLDEMFNYIGLNRRENIYITNIIFWRPPGNRTPTKSEIKICLPITRLHIRLFNPKMLILLGNIASKSLLNTEEGISKLRVKELQYIDEENALAVPVKALFHPAYLLRNPIEKKKVWDDLINLEYLIKKKKIKY